jgi:hypothetical protein
MLSLATKHVIEGGIDQVSHVLGTGRAAPTPIARTGPHKFPPYQAPGTDREHGCHEVPIGSQRNAPRFLNFRCVSTFMQRATLRSAEEAYRLRNCPCSTVGNAGPSFQKENPVASQVVQYSTVQCSTTDFNDGVRVHNGYECSRD